ncbi:hypothetical protein ACQKFG_26510 [Peribacillus sp. NPDC076916]|uniref:hypothetical protein n=1 Tax=Peribacillus sp. NPDC076916 TaxID=3390608 RepID=UPI003D01C9BC
MKVLKRLLFSCLAVMLFSSLLSTEAYAGGQKNNYVYKLGKSGSSGTFSKLQKIRSGLYFTACGKVTYDLEHIVNFGKWDTKNFRWNTSSFKLSNLKGRMTGGVALTGNYENTKYNKLDHKYSGVELKSGTFKYSWNRTMPLGPKNKNAHYDVTTKSGWATPSINCNNEANVVLDVGGSASSLAYLDEAASFETYSDEDIPTEFTEKTESLSEAIGDDFDGQVEPLGKDVVVSHFDSAKKDTIILTQQNDNPISVNDVDDEDFSKVVVDDVAYEIGNFKNAADEKMNVVKFEKDRIYMALVTNQTNEEALKLAEELK